MPSSKVLYVAVIGIFIVGVVVFLTRGEQFEIPRGETVPLGETGTAMKETEDSEENVSDEMVEKETTSGSLSTVGGAATLPTSNREIFVTDGVKHSIPLGEILSGGPPKDGIPSIDDPKFISITEADEFLASDDVGLGVVHKGEARFYPFQILVWHEIVNDTIAGDPVLVTYCPLCATGITFDRKVDGVATEFGVSGRLWQSNLLMYNRSADPDDESLWSQVLGEAVLGEFTGTRLAVVSSDTVRWGDWKKNHPDTTALSRDTGSVRAYGADPYGDYYTNERVSFGATFNDDRLHPKEFVLGVEIGGQYKAYVADQLPEGTTVDSFAGKTITIEKSDIGEVRMFVGTERESLAHIDGFWFSWVAVHPETALYGK